MNQPITWAKSAIELASRQTLPSPLPRNCEVLVAQGCQALLIGNGILFSVLAAGCHNLDSLLRSLPKPAHTVSVVWADGSELRETFIFKNIRTRDNIPLEVTLEISLSLKNLSLFYFSLLQEKNSYARHELKSYLFGELRNSIEAFLAVRTIADITTTRDFKDRLDLELRDHCRLTLEQNGIVVTNVVAISFNNPEIQALKNFGATLTLQTKQKELELQAERDGWAVDKQRLALATEQKHTHQRHDAILQDRSRERNFLANQQILQQKYRLEQLKLEQEQELAMRSQQFRQEMEKNGQYHKIALSQTDLEAGLTRKTLVVTAAETCKDKSFHSEWERRKHQAHMESEIAQIATQTQQRRSEIALEIQEKMALLEYQKAQYQIKLAEMRQTVHQKVNK